MHANDYREKLNVEGLDKHCSGSAKMTDMIRWTGVAQKGHGTVPTDATIVLVPNAFLDPNFKEVYSR